MLRIPAIATLILFLLIEVGSGQEKKEEIDYPVPPPLVYRGIYPCTACHRTDVSEGARPDEETNPFLGTYLRAPDSTPRILVRMHRDIDLKHGKGEFWCLTCHEGENRNHLALFNGKSISFEDSHLLCGQCHGSIYRDWKLGIHGRRVGQWKGKKLYMLCSHCHNPHDPKFRKISSLDPPRPPSYGRWEDPEHHHEPEHPHD